MGGTKNNLRFIGDSVVLQGKERSQLYYARKWNDAGQDKAQTSDVFLDGNGILLGVSTCNALEADGSGIWKSGNLEIDSWGILGLADNVLFQGRYSAEIGCMAGDITLKPLNTVILEGELKISNNIRLPHNTAIYAGRDSTNTSYLNLIYSNNDRIYIGGGTNRAEASYIYSKTNNVGIVPALDAPSSATYTSYFYADKDGTVTCGTNTRRWYRIYAKNATISTSDRREKENIIPLGEYPIPISTFSLSVEPSKQIDIHSELFDRLKPVQYNFINGNKRTSFGLIAQDVLASMAEIGICEDVLDLVHHDTYIDEETGEKKETFGIAYENLIALLIHEVQKLKKGQAK